MPTESLTTSLEHGGQAPLDSKIHKFTLTELTDLGNGNTKPFKYYDHMKVFCAENEREYTWRERKQNETDEHLLTSDFTYPNGAIYEGFDYSGKDYNFFLTPLYLKEKQPSTGTSGKRIFIVNEDGTVVLGNQQTTLVNVEFVDTEDEDTNPDTLRFIFSDQSKIDVNISGVLDFDAIFNSNKILIDNEKFTYRSRGGTIDNILPGDLAINGELTGNTDNQNINYGPNELGKFLIFVSGDPTVLGSWEVLESMPLGNKPINEAGASPS